MKKLFCAAALLATVTFSHASVYVGPWTPVYKGIDLAKGTNFPPTTMTNNGVVFTDSYLQVVRCMRVDLTDPDVQTFVTPRATNGYTLESRETLSLSISNFVRIRGVQVAIDANFYSVNPGGSDPTAEGLPSEVDGLLISTGQVVSVPDSSSRYASLMFTTNKTPSLVWNNSPSTPANTTGIYSAVTGFYPVVTNGVNLWTAPYYSAMAAAYPDSYIHGPQPRTVYGLSQDKRYLYLMTIDGRQPGYSDNALDVESAMWILLFGAWDAVSMDGGGTTAMYMNDACAGHPVPVNHSSYLVQYGRERYVGAHFGVYAKPLPSFIYNSAAVPGDTVATITWTTQAPASSQVEYGLTPAYGTLSTSDPTPVTDHSLVLSGLTPGKQYYYKLISSPDGGVTLYTSTCNLPFRTTNTFVASGMVFDLAGNWKYTTANLDSVPNWTTPGYSDAAWTGPTQGVLYVDTGTSYYPTSNPAIYFLDPAPTQMPFDPVTTYPYITYYFRRHFTYTNSPARSTLTFSNYIDDAAAFYLNGVLVKISPRMFITGGAAGDGGDALPTPVFNANLATGYYCAGGNATCPYVFTLGATNNDGITNLIAGDNVLAVEVHNFSATSPDITFGSALLYSVAAAPPSLPPFITNVVASPGETAATITWTTLSNSTSVVQYGLTASLGSLTNDPTLVTSHSMTLTGLQPLTKYYFKVSSIYGGVAYTNSGTFTTVAFYAELVDLTDPWVYQTNDFDGVNWQARVLDESTWFPGVALLYIETNVLVAPRNTLLPATPAGLPYPTYYFRTHFTIDSSPLFPFNTNLAGFSLLFTNYIDDGAVFYLNGTEIQRVRMPAAPQPISYTDLATACAPVNCAAVASAPDLFRISGDLLTNLVAGGDNVLAAEVHQYATNSPNVVFGSALGLVRALASETRLHTARLGNLVSNYWDGVGFTLQQAHTLGGTNAWSDVPGPVKSSPYVVTNPPGATFYRLTN